MKKIMLLSVIFFMACSTSRKNDAPVTMHAPIKEFLERHAHNPGSYEPVKTVAIDTFYDGQNNKCAYEFLHACLLENSAGVMEMKSLYVQSDVDLHVLNIVDDPYKRHSSPCAKLADTPELSEK